MSTSLVRVCPACGTQHPAENMRCDCGALLFGLDLVRPRLSDAQEAVDAEREGLSESMELLPAHASAVTCPHDDCGQPNPAGSEHCLYCNRPLKPAESVPAAVASAASRPHAAIPAQPHPSAPILLQLPSALRDRYRVLRPFEARGAEADILLVEHRGPENNAPTPLIAKIYRQGIRPCAEVQARIARVDSRHRVTVFEAGVSDGHAYEVMEYCAHGSLRQYMKGQALPMDFIHGVIHELAAALTAVHEVALVHRDLKPENMLLRSEQPLDMVLTDFSTASVMEATQRFTGMARTLLYAPPEALSGVLDTKADYWALGMLLLEMATGAHPFKGLSEAVILHQLTTRAIDVSAVSDKRLRQLLSGLLLRNPGRRWGSRELMRWLAGDRGLPDAIEEEAGTGFSQPYAVLNERCDTPEQLAVAFARHWQAGVSDLASGQLLRWFTEVQQDQNAVRLLLTLRYESDLSVDEQLLRFILHFAPGLPPMWRGQSIELPSLLRRADLALQGDDAAAEWLNQLHRHRVLSVYANAGNAQTAEIAERWSAAADSFDAAWAAYAAQLKNRVAPRNGAGEVVLFDEVVYGQGSGNQSVRPPPAALHPRLLAMAYDPAWVERLRDRLVRELAALSAQYSWVMELGDPMAMAPAQLLACETQLPEVRRATERQARREEQLLLRQAELREELRAALQSNLAQISQRARQVPYLFPGIQTHLLRQVLEEHADLLARIRAHDDTGSEWLAVRRQALRSEPAVLRLRDLCDRLSECLTANEGWFGGEAILFGFLGLVMIMVLLNARVLLITLGIAAAIAVWRCLPSLHMVQDIHRLAKSLRRPDWGV